MVAWVVGLGALLLFQVQLVLAKFILPHKEWADEAWLRGAHVVAACSNNDSRETEWPAHFASVIEEGNDLAADTRARTLALGTPPITQMFDHVYSDPHPVIDEQRAWLLAYEAAMGVKA